MKIEGSGSGSISKRHGSADPDPHQNVTDPQHCLLLTIPPALQELSAAQAEQDAIRSKLAALEKKIIVGGENLLEKAEEQERLLEASARELDETIKKEQILRCLFRCISALRDRGISQCCGSGMFIPDLYFSHPGFEFFPSRIRIKEFK